VRAVSSPESPGRVGRYLEAAPPWLFSAYATTAAFATYFCMYAFRKPFAVGTYAGTMNVAGAVLDHKTVFVIAQVMGYAASKFLGIKLVSEMKPARRAMALLACIGAAELALLLFAIAPPGLGALCLFLNGLPLGIVWGLVFGFLEGRRVSDLLGAGLCASFILASGFVKTIGKSLLDAGLPEAWMPATTGALFLAPLALSTLMLAQIPPPSEADKAERVERVPMDGAARRAFFGRFAPGLVALVVAYMALTALRDFRDNFARELWDALGYGSEPSIMTTAEIPVAVGSLVAVAAMMGIRRSRLALAALHGLMFVGALLPARRDEPVSRGAHLPRGVDDHGGARAVHGLRAVQLRALRPPDRGHGLGGDRGVLDLCGRRLWLPRQRGAPAVQEPRGQGAVVGRHLLGRELRDGVPVARAVHAVGAVFLGARGEVTPAQNKPRMESSICFRDTLPRSSTA
jgi:hypothetical protein